MPDDVGLDLRLVDERCRDTAGGWAAFGALLQGGTNGACGSRKARVTLTAEAAAGLKRAGQAPPGPIVLCVNPRCGAALESMRSLQGILALLR